MEIKFNADQCGNLQNDSHSAWYCEKVGLQDLNGVEIDRIEFSLENQDRKNIAFETEVYFATFVVKTPSDASGKSVQYRSEYTYYPDGDKTLCGFLK